jgi:hypothetical protein
VAVPVVHDLWTASVDDGDSRITRQVDEPPPCGRRPRGARRPARLPRVTSDGTLRVPPEEVYALAAGLGEQAYPADDVAARLAGAPAVGGPLQAALEDLFTCHRTAARAVAGELRWLGTTISAVVDSWLDLDGSLLGPRGQVRPE